MGAIKSHLLISLFSLPFSLLVVPLCVFLYVPLSYITCVDVCLFPYPCVYDSFDTVACLCVVDTVLLSTTSSLCLRPTTGPPSVSVFPTSTLNSSSLSTTSWSGTVQCSITLPQHFHLALSHPTPPHGTCLCSSTGTGTL